MINDASMDTKFDDFAKRDGPTERRSDGATDTAAYRDAMDASKNLKNQTDYKYNQAIQD